MASNVRTDEASDHAEQILGNVAFRLPHSPELARQTLAGNLLADLSLKDSRGFRKELEAVSREVFGC